MEYDDDYCDPFERDDDYNLFEENCLDEDRALGEYDDEADEADEADRYDEAVREEASFDCWLDEE